MLASMKHKECNSERVGASDFIIVQLSELSLIKSLYMVAEVLLKLLSSVH